MIGNKSRAAELVLLKKKQALQKIQKGKRAAALLVTKRELLKQTDLPEKRAGKLAVAKQTQESQYARSLIEASLDPLVTISVDGKILDVNDASIKVTGKPRKKLIGTNFSNYFTDPEKAQKGYLQAFEKGFVSDYALTIKHVNGKLTDVLYNASVYKDDHGNVLGVFAAARDVTEQKQTSQYARSLIEASLDPLVTISVDGKILDVNEASVKVTGTSRAKLIGTNFSNYFTEPEKAQKGYLQAFEKGFVSDYALTIKHVNGNLTDVLYNASVYKDSAGKVLGVFAAARDVTEQKWAKDLRIANIELAFQNNEKEKRAAELSIANEELHFQNNEKEKRAAELIVANKELSFQNEEKEKRAAELGVANAELAFQNNEKEKRASELIIANKELVFQNEEKEKRAAELIAANKELVAFTYISSHDLQEPMRKIQTFAGRLVETEHQNLSETGKDYFKRMQSAANRMQLLLTDLLAFSRVNSGELKFETTDLKSLVEEVGNDFKEKMEAIHATFEIKQLGTANIVPIQFRQLVQNLLGNALKFSKPDKAPHIIVHSKVARGSELYKEKMAVQPQLRKLSADRSYCHITFSDNGIGFEPEFKEQIFEVFQRLHSKKDYEGTGIGLAIVKKIVENHNGIITATSELDKGATFDIYIPN